MTIPISEALRYLGIRDHDPDTLARVKAQARALEDRVTPRYTYRICPIERHEKGWLLKEADILLPGRLAGKMMASCHLAALLLCTLGAQFDAMLRAAQARDMAAAVMLDACGSAYVEAGCDSAQREIAARFPDLYLTDRFSPGYGDLPLALQGDWLRALNGEKRLGVCETKAHVLIPAKSVTAVLGLSSQPQPAILRGCGVCALKGQCAYRERGLFCDS